jgi:hypothetical protein
MPTLYEALQPAQKIKRTTLTLTNAGQAYLAPATELARRTVLYVYNPNASAVLYWGDSTVTGASNGLPINPGQEKAFAVGANLYLASPTAGATAIIMEML